MPNIRIKDIPTTASATSSTDFIGIDGSANGTRKLDAFSPTFGGNLTVSGAISGTAANSLRLANSGSGDSQLWATGPNVSTRGTFNFVVSRSDLSSSIGALAIAADGTSTFSGATAGTVTLAAGAITATGNLTISGTGTQTLNGKLDVITAASSAANVDIAVLRQNYAGTAGHEGLISFTNISGASVGKIGTRAVDGNNTSLVLRNFVSGSLADALTLSPSVATLTGNLTVSGTSYNYVGGNKFFRGFTNYNVLYTGATELSINNQADGANLASFKNNGNLLIGTTNDAPNARLHVLGANNAGFRIDQGSYNYYSAYEHIFQAVSFGTIYGKFANNGSLILKSDGVDSSNGRLQLATHTTSAGGIGFGTDTSLSRSDAGRIVLTHVGGTAPIFQLFGGATQYLYIEGGASNSNISQVSGSLSLLSNNTTALTLDSSQNAKFVGRVRIGSSTIGASANPWFTAVASNGDFGLGFQGSANGAIRTGIKYTVATNLGGLDFMVGGDNNNDASVTALSLSAAGDATFAGTVTAGTWSSGTADKLKVSTAVNDYAAYFANIASSGGSYGIRLHTNTTAATDYLLVATSGAGGGSTRFIIKSNGTLNAPSLPTSSAGLSAGDIWNDGGTLKIV